MSVLGPHLTIDGYDCPRSKLEDLELVYRILDEFPARIGMTKIMPPYVFRYYGKLPEKWGLSGFVLIAESHISIHTFPEGNFLSVDIFACVQFNTEEATSFIQEAFGIKRIETNLIERGRDYPFDLKKAQIINLEERRAIAS